MQLCNMLFVVVLFRKVVCKSNDILKKKLYVVYVKKKDQKSGLFLCTRCRKKLCINPLHPCKKETTYVLH